MFAFGDFFQHPVNSMKKNTSRNSSFRILALTAGIILSIAALALTAHYAKSVRQLRTQPGNVVTAPQPALARSATQPFDVDQSCSLGCTATVPTAGAVNSAINFQASANATGCATTPSYQWNFGDGSPISTQQNPTKTYTSPGTYTWTMTASASTGTTDIDTVVGGYGEGNPALQSPYGALLSIARDPLERGIFVVDRLNDTSYIRFINTTVAPVNIAGKTIAAGATRFLAGGGLDISTENLTGSKVDLGNVAGIAADPAGNLLYISNSLDQNIRILNISGVAQNVTGGTVNPGNVRTFQATGITIGSNVSSLKVAPNGDLYVCDATPGINKVYRVTSAGAGSTFAGSGGATTETEVFANGSATAIPLLAPRAVEFSGADTYIADTGHGRVIKVTGGAATLVSQFTIGSGVNRRVFPPFDTAPIVPPFPSGLAWFNNKLYVAMGNSQVVVRMDGTTPVIVSGAKTTACEYTSTNCGDGGSLASMLYSLNGSSGSAQQPVVGFEADPTRGVYISDQAPISRGRIRFLNFGNSTVTVNGVAINSNSGDTIAGNGASIPYNGSLAASAGVFNPSGLTLDANGNVWFVERTSGRIRFVNRGSNAVTLFASTESAQTIQPGRIITVNRDLNLGNTAVEGPVLRTTFTNPQGLFATANGVYIVDTEGGPSVRTNPNDPATTINKTRTTLIRFINTSSANVTFYPGSSSPIVVAPGNIGTIAGGGTSSPSIAPEGFALSIVMAGATDIAVANDGTLYIADTGNKKVRKIVPNTGTSSSLTLSGAKQYVGLALDTAGRLYVVNYDDGQLLRENTAGGGVFTRMDGGGLNRPRDVVVDAEGNAYVVNSQVSTSAPGTNANRIMRVAAAGGAATTFAGTVQGFAGDGGPATSAEINVSPANPSYTAGSPNLTAPIVTGIARATATGNIFFADTMNDRLRMLSTATASCIRTGTITISGTNPAPTLASISPTTALANSGAFTLTLTGTGFVPASIARWNSTDLTTTFVSATSITAQVPATLITAAGTAQVTVFNPTPGGGTSSAQTFTITAPNPVPTLTNLSPASAAEGSPGFTLTVTGTNFVNGSVIRWDGSARPTTFVSATQLTAQIPATDLSGGAGTAQITVFNPTPGGGASNALQFQITSTNPVPVLTTLTPGSANAGGAAFTLNVTGASFVANSVVRWNGLDRVTTFNSATSLSAQILASDIANAGTANITVFNPTPGGGVSGTLTFNIGQAPNPLPTLASLNPNTAAAGTAGLTLTLTGTNFLSNSVVRWNNSDRATTFVSATQLTAQITPADLANAGTAQVTVFNPASPGGGGGASSPQTFTITASNNPAPTLTSISPSTVLAGGATFTLTLTGTNFIPSSVVRINNADRLTTFVNNTTLTVSINASEITTAGTRSVVVFNPAPGGGTSAAQTLTISNNNPTPTLTSLNPTNVGAGGAAFTLTVNGTNFIAGSVVRFNGGDRVTTFVNSTQVTAALTAADIAAAGQATITVFNPAPGGGLSNSLALNIVTPNPVPTLTSLSPSTVTVGGPAFTLTITGTGFVNPSLARFNNSDRVTIFVNSTTLTIQVLASEIATPGTATITVINPASAGGGGGTSNALTLSIVTNNPTPTLSSLSPNTAAAGGAAFALTVNGAGFVSSSIVRWNGVDRPTTLVSGTQLTAQISAADLATAGTATVTVFNPAPGGGTSNALSFTIQQPNPTPVITAISPSTVTAGGATFTLTVTGTGFTPTSIVRLNNADRLTNYVNATTLTIQVQTSEITSPVALPVAVVNPAPGGGTSNTVTLTVQSGNPLPTLSSLNPTTVDAGGGNLLLTVTGTNFVNASVVRWNGVDRPTTFVSATSLTAQIPASDIANAGSVTITVFSPAPGGGISNALTLTIVQPTNPVPTLTNLSPSSASAGGANFILTVTGTNFVNSSVVRWNNQNRVTTFVSATQLTANILASDLANVGTVPVTVFNPAPGGGTSNTVNFTVTVAPNPTPVITTVSPNPVAAGGPTFTLTVTGTGFINGSIVRFNNAERVTNFVSATTLTAQILGTDVANLGTAAITVFNPASAGGGGGVSNPISLTIGNLNPAPTIANINPRQVAAGGAAFTLTVSGTGFTPSSTVRMSGADRLTTFISATTLTIPVRAEDIATAGTAPIAVINPAPGGGTSNQTSLIITGPVASVSAASYAQVIAPDSIVAAFGDGLATGPASATSVPLPTTLGGTTVRVTDAAGVERAAQLFFVSAAQINYLLPANTALGAATITVTAGNGRVSVGRVQVERIQPGLFTANASGSGLMAAVALRIRADGQIAYEELVRFVNGVLQPIPLDLGPAGDQVFLIAFGTGIRNRNDLGNVSATLDGVALPVLFAGAQGDQVGLDQLNLGVIPRSLIGKGSVNLVVRTENKTANTVTVTIR
jgi:uncharacterized protein (TIGR03437 family)